MDRLPPMSRTPASPCRLLRPLANIHDLFGARASRPIFSRGGRLVMARCGGSARQFAVTGTALQFCPPPRLRLVLERLEQGEDCAAPHHLHEDRPPFSGDRAVPTAPDRRRATGRQARARPVHPAAIIRSDQWATGRKHLVEETACIATGIICRFRIAARRPRPAASPAPRGRQIPWVGRLGKVSSIG